MNSPKIFALLGNFFMATAFFLLVYIYLPFIMLFLPLPNSTQPTLPLDHQYSISIKKINANAPIIANVDPWDKSDYEEKLKKGVGLAKNSAEFGQKGLIYLFAHSSLPPWEMTRANTSFLRLNELEKGDEIAINKFGEQFLYKVIDKKEIWPNETSIITAETRSILILQTCTPLGTDLKRLLIYAEPTMVNEK